ncbi:hypothetical protein R5R35_010295 [Gryllus longicercus]|uniref:SMB domain-containing protein n=1 Tax=Gryllus longicercus TaxID=2509291 RepID=A0AAN9Z2T4_9ORTH
MAAGWLLFLLILLSTTSPPWRRAMVGAGATATAAAPGGVPPPAPPPTPASTPASTPTPEPTLSPEVAAFMAEIFTLVTCRSTKCTADNTLPPTHGVAPRCQCDDECNLLGECCPQIAPSRAFWKQPEAPVRGVPRRHWGCTLFHYNATTNVVRRAGANRKLFYSFALKKLKRRNVSREL